MLDAKVIVFMTVVEEGSFSKASKVLYTSPVSVMKNVNMLESLLDVKLFNRTPQGSELTREGRLYYDSMKDVQKQVNDTLAAMKKGHREDLIEIRYGVSSLTSILQFDESLGFDLFKVTEYGKFEIDLVNYEDSLESSEKLIKDLGRRIDFILGPSMIEHSEKYGFRFLQLCSSPCQIAVPRTHPLAAKKMLKMEDLDDQEIFITPRSAGNPVIAQIYDTISEHAPHARLRDDSVFITLSTFEEARKRNCLVNTLKCYHDVHHAFVTLPVEWDLKMPHGIIYSADPSDNMRAFLAYITRLRNAGYFSEKYQNQM